MKPFPLPVRVVGPSSMAEEETLHYLKMPADMGVYTPPPLPAGAPPAVLAVLVQLADALRPPLGTQPIDLTGLNPAARSALATLLGEGEVGARITQADGSEVCVQEAVFAGVWRVIHTRAGQVVADHVEVGPAPACLAAAAGQDLWPAPPVWEGPLPDGVVNAPALIAEVVQKAAAWRSGQPAEVINLTLLPMSMADIAFLDHHLGTGALTVLSRGYGNCRITPTRLANVWRVVYYNSADMVILNSVEITTLPEVTLAAPEDLRDARERLVDILEMLQEDACDGHV